MAKSARDFVWKIRAKLDKDPGTKEIINALLENRGLKTKKEKEGFLDPKEPEGILLEDVSITKKSVKEAIKRIKKAKKEKEKVVIYGDYDADGICGTAILWETLYALGIDALPYIPERFTEGYGLNGVSIETLKKKNDDLGLIITVDNGITANRAAKKAKELGIDLIITDHHQKGKKVPDALSVVHTTDIGGAGISWILSREVKRDFGEGNLQEGLDLTAIGTIADQIPLLSANRSFVKYGLEFLNETDRQGLNALFKEASVKKGTLGTYIVGFIIAPRLNAMGRLEHAIDSLRLLCTTDKGRARRLASKLGKTNAERQRVVEEVTLHAKEIASEGKWEGAIVVSHESYHEGVIGLAASRLVEDYYRPAIVISKGKKESKASARSIPGFNVIEAIREAGDLLLSGGGHPMAAGFSINTSDIDKFSKRMEKISSNLLKDDILERVLKIDLEIDFSQVDWDLVGELKKFEPTGIGNPSPTFSTNRVDILSSRKVGRDGNHLKLKLRKGKKIFDAIGFGMGELSQSLEEEPVDICYNLEENVWRGKRTIQLKVKDIRKR